ncbi:Rne/Rng family ribonuclease [Brachybacterium sp. GCM10030267]|uniref:Rne/Rng family ribonuclease n=1 Tax=Brachybacterium sp. GCM10030267 TaxID=3273381 RepID=UPI003618D359
MADSTHNPESDSSEETTTPPTSRRRRRAGAPAGAPEPVSGPEVSEETGPAAPRTVVAQQSESPIETAPAPTKRPRRRAGAPAGAPVIPPAPEPVVEELVGEEPLVEPETEDIVTEDVETEDVTGSNSTAEPGSTAAPAAAGSSDAGSHDRDGGSGDEDDNPVVDDLRALADARGGSGDETEDAGDDRSRRREQVQMDFASLLFQAPTPPRTTVGPHDAPVGGADVSFDAGADEDESDETEGTDETRRRDERPATSDDEQGGRSRSRRGRSRRSSRRDSGSDDSASAEDSTEDTASEDDSDEDSERSTGGSNGSRRRRRRGGRGRRGRGRGDEENGSDEQDDRDDQDDDSSQDERGEPSEGKDAKSDESAEGGSSGSSSSRRRRRRRRSGSNGDESTSTDDPPNTVVKVREARDEVKAVKGSTRLEAKRQRRREGRDNGRKRNVITEAEFLARRESVKRSMVVRERGGRTQIAVLEDDVLVEHYVAQKAQTSMVGNVYLGKVQNVLPSMEAAFVDIGKGRNAVLYAGEVNWDAVGLEGQPRRIELALKSGDPVLVQVTKDPIGHKGARLTSQISLPGRYLVFVPGGSMTGISRKLPDTERSRLKKLMRQLIPEDAGVIVRTAAEGASEEELTNDVARLRAQWEKIQKAQKSKSAPVALSQEPDIAIKVVRDVFNEDFTSLIVEGGKVYDEVHQYVSDVAPDLLERLTKHVGDKDVFAKHRIDEQLLKAMDRKVYLPSGGSLVIDRTEAMTVVDVNTGKFTGSGGTLEETVTKNNLEAAEEIVRQLRLRDIGGIIVIDFIDMVLESNRDLVLRRLVECLGRDRTKHQVAEVTSLGLVQMTRKRVGQGLVETFSATCEHCNGRGIVVDLDGQPHQHAGNGNGNGGNGNGKNGNGGSGGDESSKSAKRRSRRSRGGGKDDSAAEEAPAEEPQPDVHRLEDDADSRALARATIASIAAASGAHSHPEVTVDGQVIAVDDTRDPQAAEPATLPELRHADAQADPSAGDAAAQPSAGEPADPSAEESTEQPAEQTPERSAEPEAHEPAAHDAGPAAEQPAGEQSADEQPAGEQSADEQPVAEQSADEQPVAEQPAVDQQSEAAAGETGDAWEQDAPPQS